MNSGYLRDQGFVHYGGPRVPLSEQAREMAEAVMGLCCYGMAEYGPERCTCWEPIFDREQVEIDDAMKVSVEQVATRARCCEDCAYRNGSPERADGHIEEWLRELRGVAASVRDRDPGGRGRLPAAAVRGCCLPG